MAYANIMVSVRATSGDTGNKSYRYNTGYDIPVAANTFVVTEEMIHDNFNALQLEQDRIMKEVLMELALTIAVMAGAIAICIITGYIAGFVLTPVIGAAFGTAAAGVFTLYTISQVSIGLACLMDPDFERNIVSDLNLITNHYGLGNLGSFLYFNVYDADFTVARLILVSKYPGLQPTLFQDWELETGAFDMYGGIIEFD